MCHNGVEMGTSETKLAPESSSRPVARVGEGEESAKLARRTLKKPVQRAVDFREEAVPFDDARFRDIAVRILSGESKRTVAIKNHITDRQLRRIMNDPGFLDVFDQERDRLYSDLGALLKNEKATDLVRAQALRKRGMTLLAEIMEHVQGQIKDDPAVRSSMLRVGVDAATGAIDRAEKVSEAHGGVTKVNVGAVVVGRADAVSIRNALDESEVDLSDLMTDWVAPSTIEAEFVEEKEDEQPQPQP